MQCAALLVIVSGLAIVPIEARYPQAVEIYSCGFEREADRNYDGWPDDWIRRRGHGYPAYLPIQIVREASPAGQHCLRLSLDGGAALLQSPPVEIEPSASYVLEAWLRTESLVQDEAMIALTFLDQDKQPLQTFRLPGVRDALQWRKLRLGPVATSHASARYAVIELSVGPVDGEDLRGSALFDDLWLARLPRMSVRTNRATNLFRPGEAAKVICDVSGFEEEQGRVTFELFDPDGSSLAGYEEAVKPPRRGNVEPQPSAVSHGSAPPRPQQPVQQQTIVWDPPVKEPGFYRVRVAMYSHDRLILDRQLSLAVIEPTGSSRGEFGWSLARGSGPLSLAELAQLLSHAGVNWVKYPLWLSEEELLGNQELARFVERLGAQQIEIVGLLTQPPENLRAKFGRQETLSAAEIFAAEPDVWYPALEPVMTQLSMKVRWWQLGGDQDTSFIGYPSLDAKIAQVKKQLDRIGQDTRLGFSWNWMEAEPSSQRPPWRFINMAGQPPFTPDELGHYLGQASNGKIERWVMIQPLDDERYPTPTRVSDLALRMVAAKKHGASRIFASQPFSTKNGLLNDDGTPGELFCPWITISQALSGARHLGSLQLPGRSENEVFVRRDGSAVIVLWNQTGRRESIELGEDMRHVDLWGRSMPLDASHTGRPLAKVSAVPSLIMGVGEPVVRQALAFQFEPDRFPSVLAQSHQCKLRLPNPFPRGASGKLRLELPQGWSAEPAEFEFRLAAGEVFEAPLLLRFPYDANNGAHDVNVHVLLTADTTYEFRIHRQLQIGLGELLLEATTELADNGELLVHQRLINRTDVQVSFRCDLYAANRRRLRTQVLELGRGEDVQTYQLPAGRELLGQTLWIRAVEVNGERILSRRFVAGE